MGNTASVLSVSPPSSLGISLSHLRQFIDHNGGRENFQNLTTFDVCQQFIIPMTSSSPSSYCSFVNYHSSLSEHDEDDPSPSHSKIQQAKVFISHPWSYFFLEVVDILFSYFTPLINSGSYFSFDEIIIWMDLFSINQHETLEDVSSTDWMALYSSLLPSFTHSLLVMTDWDEMIPFTRTWCLFELFLTFTNQHLSFDIAMPPSTRTQLLKDLFLDPQFEIQRLSCMINFQESSSTKPYDHTLIIQTLLLRSTASSSASASAPSSRGRSSSLSDCNAFLIDSLQSWMIQIMEKELTSFNSKYAQNPHAIHSLIQLYKELNDYQKIEPYLLQCHQLSSSLYGSSHPETISYLNNLAMLYIHQQRYQEALPLSLQCVQLTRETLRGAGAGRGDREGEGEERLSSHVHLHPNLVDYLANLSSLYVTLGRYSHAEPLLLEALQISNEIHGKRHFETLHLLKNLSSLYFHFNDFSNSLDYSLECLELMTQVYGPKHLNLLPILSTLAQIYQKKEMNQTEKQQMNNSALVERYLCHYLEISRGDQTTAGAGSGAGPGAGSGAGATTGDPKLIRTGMNNLATFYFHQGRYSLAESLFLELISQKDMFFDAAEEARGEDENQGRGRGRGREDRRDGEVEWIPPVEIIGYYHNLAMIYKAQEKYQQALSLFSEALKMSQMEDQRLMTISPSSSPLTSSSTFLSSSPLSSSSLRCDPRSRSMTIHLLNGLASCYNSLKNFQEAERCYEQCVEWNQEVHGPNHDKTLASLSTLGKFYKKSKRFVERGEVKGEEICEVCYERTKEKYGEDHEKTLKALKSLIEMSESNGKMGGVRVGEGKRDTKSSVSERVRRR